MKLLCRNTRAWVANKKEAQVERAFVVSCGIVMAEEQWAVC